MRIISLTFLMIISLRSFGQDENQNIGHSKMIGYDFIPFVPYEGEISAFVGHYLSFRAIPKKNIDLKPMMRLGYGSFSTSGLLKAIDHKFYRVSGGLLLSFRRSENIRINLSFTGGVSSTDNFFGKHSTGCLTICSSVELTAHDDSRIHFGIYGPSYTLLEGGAFFGIIGVNIGYKFE